MISFCLEMMPGLLSVLLSAGKPNKEGEERATVKMPASEYPARQKKFTGELPNTEAIK